MDEMDLTLPPGLESSLDEFYAEPEPDLAFASRLDRDLQHRFGEFSFPKRVPRRTFVQSLRARPALALLIVFLAIGLLSGAAYAISRLTGFIPGFGFTSGAGDVYVLQEPASGSVDGVTLQVEKAVDDGSRFWVELTRSGSLDSNQDFQIAAYILLSDGQKVQFLTGRDTGLSTGQSQMAFEFPPLPADTKSLSLQFEFITREGDTLRSVDIPLVLRPIRPGELIPVPPTQTASLQSETRDGLTLVLEHVAADSDKTILQVALRFDAPDAGLAGDWNVMLTDESGTLYPLVDLSLSSSDGVHKLYQTQAFTGEETLTLSLVMFPYGEAVHVYVGVPAGVASFTFDPGPDPRAGQSWPLDEKLQIGGFNLHVVNAQLVTGTELLFEFEPAKDLNGVMLYTSDPLLRGASGGEPTQSGNLTAGMTFESMPAHPFEVGVNRIYYTAHGPWQIQWRPPAAPESASGLPTSTPAPTPQPYVTPTLASSEPILLEVQALAQKFDTSLQGGPGWVHVVSEQKTPPKPGVVSSFPPPYLRTEEWFEIDAGGYVTRNLYSDYDASGQIVQQAATVDNYSVNFTTGDSGFNENGPYPLSLDTQTQLLSRAAESDSANFTREETTCETGSACLLITSWEIFSNPIQNHGEPQPFTGIGRRVWIDLETGQQVQIQSFWLLADGSERVDHTQRVLVVEKVETPPQEILEILSRVVVP
jgi:hypothetical protein